MERIHFRSTSVLDIQAELRERELLREARARMRARQEHPLGHTGSFGLSLVARRILG